LVSAPEPAPWEKNISCPKKKPPVKRKSKFHQTSTLKQEGSMNEVEDIRLREFRQLKKEIRDLKVVLQTHTVD
jgi:hypothetical protein